MALLRLHRAEAFLCEATLFPTLGDEGIEQSARELLIFQLCRVRTSCRWRRVSGYGFCHDAGEPLQSGFVGYVRLMVPV